jgi:hypothetical protein
MLHPAVIRKCGGFAITIMSGQLQCTIEIKGPVAHLVGFGNGIHINLCSIRKRNNYPQIHKIQSNCENIFTIFDRPFSQ